MNEKDYKELNYYLNGCFKQLEKNDSFLLRNIDTLGRLGDDFVHLTDKYDLETYNDEINLTFEDVYLLAREIVESINPNYLSYYDNLIQSGQLDFDYKKILDYSSFKIDRKRDIRLIDIRRSFNYTDVTVLIHEFMHYMACLEEKDSINKYLLTEAISIYFQEYAKRYLINKGIPKDKLFLNERIIYTQEDSKNFYWYHLILFSYENFGEIDDKTYELLNEYRLKISKDAFLNECKNFLRVLEKKDEQCEDEYKELMITNEDNNLPNYEQFLFEKLINLFDEHYRYILGTYIAYYALENSTLDKMVYLCDNINKFPYSMMGVTDVLLATGIDIDKLDISIIEKYLDENETKRRQI